MAESEPVASRIEQIRQLASQGQIEAAEAISRELIKAAPHEPEAWSWLGLLASARRNWPDAAAALEQAIALDAKNPYYWSYLSVARHGLGQNQEAESCAREALEIDSRQPSYWTNLALALREQGRWDEAANAYRQALALEPANAATWQALAAAEQDAGHTDAAAEAFERALAIAPGGEATIGYAYLLALRGQPGRSIELLRNFLATSPHIATAWMVLAHAFKLSADFLRAERACQEAIRLDPKLVEPQALLAEIFLEQRRLSDAEFAARDLIDRQPQFAPGWATLGIILSAGAQQEEALAALRRAVELSGSQTHHSRLLGCLQYGDGVEPDFLLREHRHWGAPFSDINKESAARGAVSRHHGGKLRLGFVSGDFCQHPIGFLALPALERLDKDACAVICYSDRIAEDAFTERFRKASDQWHNTCGKSDEQVAEQIRRDEIDVLFDLAGHQGNRLPLFARRAAPIQITWLGYAGTTGLATMDYILADRHHIRSGEEQYYSEAVLRLPHGYACFGQPDDAPGVAPLPAASGSPFTFGCFNHPAKLSSSSLAAWAEILARVPNSRLLLKFTWLDDLRLQERIHSHFERRNIDRKRVIFEGAAPRQEMLAAYGRVDLALDTQPYSGGLTTCEAMWMGVPVITWPGKTFAGRHSTSHLTTAGFLQFVAVGPENYVELAVDWAGRIGELAALRASMREQVRASPLCDAPGFAADLLRVLQAVSGSRR